MFLKMKHAEFSLYSRSCEVSRKFLTNTFGRKKKSSTARATLFNPLEGTSHQNTADQAEAYVKDSICDASTIPTDISAGGAGDYNDRRADGDPDAPVNIVTALYYMSQMQAVEMKDDTQETTDTGECLNLHQKSTLSALLNKFVNCVPCAVFLF